MEDEERESPRLTLLEAGLAAATVLAFPLAGPLGSGAIGCAGLGIALTLRLRRRRGRPWNDPMEELRAALEVDGDYWRGRRLGGLNLVARCRFQDPVFYQGVTDKNEIRYVLPRLGLSQEIRHQPDLRKKIERLGKRLPPGSYFWNPIRVEIEEEHVYLVYDRFPGRQLLDLADECPLPVTRALYYGRQLLEAAVVAHREGFRLRRLTCRTIYLEDAGLVINYAQSELETMQQELDRFNACGCHGENLMHDLQSLCPEVICGAVHEPSSDQFIIASLIFHLLTGELPFAPAEEPMAYLMRVLTEPARKLREVRAELPEELEAVLARMLSKEPSERFPDCEQALAALPRLD